MAADAPPVGAHEHGEPDIPTAFSGGDLGARSGADSASMRAARMARHAPQASVGDISDMRLPSPDDEDFEDATSEQRTPGTRLESTPAAPSEGLRDIRDVEAEQKREMEHKAQDDPTSLSSPSKEGPSEWSHQHLAPQGEERKPGFDDLEWQEMPAYAPFKIYNDDGKLVAEEKEDSDVEEAGYSKFGGRGYTRVEVDEDAQSATSLDDHTAYLFKESTNRLDDDDEARDAVSQMQATKDLLTPNERIAYVGVVRLAAAEMLKQLGGTERTKGNKSQLDVAVESMKMWTQKMMVRLYAHMELESAEQLMIEQLTEHGLQPSDLTPTLMRNSRVKNPVPQESLSERVSTEAAHDTGPSTPADGENKGTFATSTSSLAMGDSAAPPPYSEEDSHEAPQVLDAAEMPTGNKIDIDIRWTVLCDLFLVLIADSIYDARSRDLLERVGAFLDVPWMEICRFEKRVTDALEMQEDQQKEEFNEDEHIETRRKEARRKRLMYIGLATVGGGLVIGLSAGALAPVIGAGLAAGLTTIGISGTGTVLGSTAASAIIGAGFAGTGANIGFKASSRRAGAVKTFEYRPLHNNKRVNLIITVAGWMSGKVDDVRLPFSTVNPIMGDMFSVLWEPEMLKSMGETINILATEALVNGLQQILGATILGALMAAVQLPLVLTKLAYLIDNPWSVSCTRADAAGLILADSLIDRSLGTRPVTLVGFSLGSRVIFSALKELAKKGAVGLVQNVYIFGCPAVVKKDDFLRMRTIVAGRFVNSYATNDWILAYLFRATSGGPGRVAGLAPIEIPGIENFDVSKFVPGHMSYRTAMPRCLREVGWAVDADEFSEIEDPDPDNHESRQRQLIDEIEDARKELEQGGKKRRFALFGRTKAVEKKAWETYDERSNVPRPDAAVRDGDALFDVDALRGEVLELATEGMKIKELGTTLGPLRLDSAALEPAVTPRPSSAPRPADAEPRPAATNGSAAPEQLEHGADDDDDDVTLSFDPADSGAAAHQENDPTGVQRAPARDAPEAEKAPPVRGAEKARNPWDDDDEFGAETEMEMTFE